MLGRSIERTPLRHYCGRVFGSVVSILLGIKVYDTQCGAKMFRVGAETQPLWDSRFISPWVFDVELLLRYLSKGSPPRGRLEAICEHPLPCWRDVRGSKLKPSDFAKSFIDLMRIRLHYGGRHSIDKAQSVRARSLDAKE